MSDNFHLPNYSSIIHLFCLTIQSSFNYTSANFQISWKVSAIFYRFRQNTNLKVSAKLRFPPQVSHVFPSLSLSPFFQEK